MGRRNARGLELSFKGALKNNLSNCDYRGDSV